MNTDARGRWRRHWFITVVDGKHNIPNKARIDYLTKWKYYNMGKKYELLPDILSRKGLKKHLEKCAILNIIFF